jgi:hypothetical protein
MNNYMEEEGNDEEWINAIWRDVSIWHN